MSEYEFPNHVEQHVEPQESAPEVQEEEVVEEAPEIEGENDAEEIVHDDSADESNDESSHDEDDIPDDGELPEGIKARLGRQEKRHKREMRRLEAELAAIRNQAQTNYSAPAAPVDAWGGMPVDPWTGQPIDDGSVQAEVQKALMAQQQQLKQQELLAAQQKEAEQLQSMQKEYLDNVYAAADKYDDFEDVVSENASKFTPDMQLAAQFVSNPGDVLYALAKNPKELDKINRLPKFQQMRAMVKFAENYNAKKVSKRVTKAPKPIEQSKGNSTLRGNDPSRMSYQELKMLDRQRANKRRK